MDAKISFRLDSYSWLVKNDLTFSNSDKRSYAVIPELVALPVVWVLPPLPLSALPVQDMDRFNIDLGDGC
jgi:hypothetical protein